MKQVIPFYKEIVFKNNIANLTSISLEHKENVLDGEVSGEFIIFGDYKVHNDTTEKEEFKYKLPFTALIPDDVDPSTVVVDIADFRYEQIDEDVLRIDIDFSIEGEELRIVQEDVLDMIEDDSEENIDEQIEDILSVDECVQDETVVEAVDEVVEDVLEVDEAPLEREVEESVVEEKHEEKVETMEEYITYHVHVVSNTDSVESIIKLYNTNLDVLNEYNDIKELKVGDKVIIPEYLDE